MTKIKAGIIQSQVEIVAIMTENVFDLEIEL